MHGTVWCRVGFGRAESTLVLVVHALIGSKVALLGVRYVHYNSTLHTHMVDVEFNYYIINDGYDTRLCVDFDFG